METPKWATDLLREVALKNNKYRKRPDLVFKLSRRRGWHGVWRPYDWEIIIYTPYRMKKTYTFVFDEGKLMLLHEITHWLTPREHHSKKFYRKLFRLCRKYEIDEEAFESEFNYKPRGSKKAYKQIYGKVWNKDR